MRILFVAMAESIHTARWINQIVNEGWDIHLFPSTDASPNYNLKNLTYHDGMIRYSRMDKSVHQTGTWPWPFPSTEKWAGLMLKRFRRIPPLSPYRIDGSRKKRLSEVICKIHPDIIHSLEIQHSGYLTLDAKNEWGGTFPPWIVTNWGSDIYYFGRFSEHADKIKAVLTACDYYNCECHRDVALGGVFGFAGEVLPVLPNTGGFDLGRAAQFRQKGPTSSRRLILLKGYQNWAGRAMQGLHAIAMCAENLKEFHVAIYSAGSEIRKAARVLSQRTGMTIDFVPFCSHDDMLRLYGKARIHIGLSISDAISTSLLESIVMGTFPIQSCTACTDEWIVDGQTGLVVPPEDPKSIAAAIRRAVLDDDLVDTAAEINMKLAQERLDYGAIKEQVIAIYNKIWTTSNGIERGLKKC